MTHHFMFPTVKEIRTEPASPMPPDRGSQRALVQASLLRCAKDEPRDSGVTRSRND